MENNILELKNISKIFSGSQVLFDVDLNIKKGELHAIVGENGAGKSTLIKIISGVHQQENGDIYFKGKRVNFHTPSDAQKIGISTLFQELQEIPNLTVAENIFAGIEPKKMGMFVDWPKLYSRAQKLIDESSLDIDELQNMHDISVSSRKMVEIIRAVHRDVSVIIMDEPTANLDKDELDALFSMIEELKRQEISIIYISHRMNEIFELADRVSVLRDGNLIKTLNIEDCSEKKLIKFMIGREIPEVFPEKLEPEPEIVMSAQNISLVNSEYGELKNISFDLQKKEILGIYGLGGSGVKGLFKSLFGLLDLESGSLKINGGKSINLIDARPRDCIDNGIAYLPEERKTEGLFLNQNIKDNITISLLHSNFSKKGMFLKEKEELSSSKDIYNKLGIKGGNLRTKVDNLSGGNQQKVLLGKWLFDSFEYFLLENPTRGVDIGAKIDIYNEINKLAKDGKSVIMFSSELPELLGMCNRIMVMREGEIVSILSGEEMIEEKIIDNAVLK